MCLNLHTYKCLAISLPLQAQCCWEWVFLQGTSQKPCPQFKFYTLKTSMYFRSSYSGGVEAVDKVQNTKPRVKTVTLWGGRKTKTNCVCTRKWPVCDENKVGSGPRGMQRPGEIFTQPLSVLPSAPSIQQYHLMGCFLCLSIWLHYSGWHPVLTFFFPSRLISLR